MFHARRVDPHRPDRIAHGVNVPLLGPLERLYSDHPGYETGIHDVRVVPCFHRSLQLFAGAT